MRCQGIIGKRIVRIVQQRAKGINVRRQHEVFAIVLEDGTELRPLVMEPDLKGRDEYAVDMIVCRPVRRS